MKCPNCGFENELGSSTCPQCQAEIQPNPAAQKILGALKDALFLVICILMSASCLLSLSADNVPLIEILLTVFLWLTYAQGCKGNADAKHLRCISGAVYANYVITYVAAGLVLVLGLIFAAAFGMFLKDPAFLETLKLELNIGNYTDISPLPATFPSGLIIFLSVLAAGIIVVINIFSLRYIHRFAQSVYRSIEAGVLALKHAAAAKVLMFIYAGFSAVSCLTNLTTNQTQLFLSDAADAATCIIAGLLIHKYFSDEPATALPPQDENA